MTSEMLDRLRREFLVIMGESYDQYGYPTYCGWIEGLLLLETRVWTQKDISDHLHRLFPESKYPTSVPSVNRALKLLETYGVVEKSGSRKIGYKYRLMPSSSLIVTMLQMFMAVNQNFLKKLEDLSSQNIEDDPELKNAITYQVNGGRLWGELIEKLLKSVSGTENWEKQKEGIRRKE